MEEAGEFGISHKCIWPILPNSLRRKYSLIFFCLKPGNKSFSEYSDIFFYRKRMVILFFWVLQYVEIHSTKYIHTYLHIYAYFFREKDHQKSSQISVHLLNQILGRSFKNFLLRVPQLSFADM